MVARAISFSQFTSSFLCDISDVELILLPPFAALLKLRQLVKRKVSLRCADYRHGVQLSLRKDNIFPPLSAKNDHKSLCRCAF